MRAILITAGILGGAMPSPAQPPNSVPPVFDESILVSATLEEEAPEEVPASVTLIDRDEIEDRQATGVAELLRTVPGVDVARSGSPGKVTSVFVRGANSNHTLVLWNGVRLNDPFFGGFDWAFLPAEGVSRVEVARGPFSALYGSEAIGGVVQVVTAAAPGARVRLEGGSRDFLRGSASAATRTGPVRLEAAGHVRRGEGVLDNDDFDGEEGTVRAVWEVGRSASLGVVARANRSEIGLPFDFLGQPSPERRQERDTVQLAVPFTWSSGPWEIEGHLDRSAVDLAVRDPQTPSAASDTEAERTAGRVVVTRRFGGGDGGSWAAVGADWQREEVSDATSSGVNLDARSQSTRSAFGELFVRSGRWTVDLGLRHDDHDAFGGETSFKAGAAVRLTPALRLRGSYGEGFRAPSIGDLFFPGFGNPDLEPERSESYELGADWRTSAGGAGDGPGPSPAGGPWRVSLVAFQTDLDDLIVFDFARSLPLNLGRARSRGVELAVGYEGRAFGLRTSATVQDPEDLETGEQLLRRPEEKADAVLTVRPAERWTVNAVGRYVGERPDFGATLESYTTLDLAASLQATQRLEPYARVENVLDEDYREVAGFPAPGRTWIAGLEVGL